MEERDPNDRSGVWKRPLFERIKRRRATGTVQSRALYSRQSHNRCNRSNRKTTRAAFVKLKSRVRVPEVAFGNIVPPRRRGVKKPHAKQERLGPGGMRPGTDVHLPETSPPFRRPIGCIRQRQARSAAPVSTSARIEPSRSVEPTPPPTGRRNPSRVAMALRTARAVPPPVVLQKRNSSRQTRRCLGVTSSAMQSQA